MRLKKKDRNTYVLMTHCSPYEKRLEQNSLYNLSKIRQDKLATGTKRASDHLAQTVIRDLS